MPTPQGMEPLPMPREKLPKAPLNQPGDEMPQGNEPPPSFGLPPDQGFPSLNPNEPGGLKLPDDLNIPSGDEKQPAPEGTPGDQGDGFNPLPSLPPDLNLPDSLDKKDKDKSPDMKKGTSLPLDKKSGRIASDLPKNANVATKPIAAKMDLKPEAPKKGATSNPSTKKNNESGMMKPNIPTRLPEVPPTDTAENRMPSTEFVHPQANWDAALQPGVYAETSRSGFDYPSTEFAQQTGYEAPLAAEGKAGYSGEVVQQSFQQNQPAGNPPMALKGYCPVELARGGRWVQGDPRWTAIHRGFIYRFSSEQQRAQFLAHPEDFVPGNGGNDPVISTEEHRNVPGDLNFCAAFKGRLYMFTSSATQAEFQKNPEQFLGGR
jgi:YHS domain-containing protein